MPMPTGFNLTSYGCNGSNTGCAVATASHAGRYDRFKAWLCYRPTTGDALPKLNPHPYVGPIAGTFPCGPSGVGGGCGDGPGYAAASGGCAVADSGRGRVGPLMPGRGCQGQCVPPSDDAFPGYRFANPLSQTQGQPSNTPPLTQPIGYTTYKQIVGQGAKPAARP